MQLMQLNKVVLWLMGRKGVDPLEWAISRTKEKNSWAVAEKFHGKVRNTGSGF